ncbi:ComEC/Rec2 family competence protein [Shimia sagamensis]|uniref:Competence protein ComEC n=1 Tax=Shimia sagamensis TaxID=1566352 RepID=A0ABY1NIJ5_9RHOB|nr:ComEC/Rec2 family competence protein [Shimia sagamensis]SMP10796.1 competence protein ComEC [Shimia sagamensis]
MRVVTYLRASLLNQYGHLFCWVPVCLGLGIGIFFALPVEPAVAVLVAIGLISCWFAWLTIGKEVHVAACLWLVALVLAGVCIAGARAHRVAGPVLEFRYYGAIEGRITAIDRSASDAVRLTLNNVKLDRFAPEGTPKRVRISLHGDVTGTDPTPGKLVGTTGHLSPPSGPVEPGGFDFQRHAWFKQIGAVGYTRVPVVALELPGNGGGIYGFRMRLSAAIQARMAPDVAGFAAAVTTGDRSGISEAVTEALRGANLAHLLAISGLHMGLLAGFVFGALRFCIALVPTVALRVDGKKIAACGSLVAATGYLLLSGGAVSTERAYVMTVVVLLAVMLERRALTLRAVAVAAIMVLVLRPEAMMGPGFQMSFAATVALVGVFGWLRDMQWQLGPKWLRPVSAVVVSSLVAGLATAPFAAMHFNHVAHYGLLANVVSVPVMGILVVPAAVVAALLVPIGLEAAPLWVMEQGLRWILTVAQFVSGLDGARGTVPSGGRWVLPVIAVGGLWLLLWQGRARVAGLAVVCIGFWLWSDAERPDVLISDTGGLVGVMTPQGRALSKAKGQGFVAENWLENDGSERDQAGAASLWPGEESRVPFVELTGGGRLIHVQGKTGKAMFDGCAPEDIVVFSTVFDEELKCHTLDSRDLQNLGSVALRFDGAAPLRKTARQVAGRRLWNDAELRGQ